MQPHRLVSIQGAAPDGRPRRRSQRPAGRSLTPDLYGQVGNTLLLLALRLDALLQEQSTAANHEQLRSLRVLVTDAMQTLREVTDAVDADPARGRRLDRELRRIAMAFSAATGSCAEVRVGGAVGSLPEGVADALFRVAHEALVNVDRHSRASVVLLRLAVDDDKVRLEITDDGVSLDQRRVADWRSSPHFGVAAMQRAVRSVGGLFAMDEMEPRGVRLRAVVPLRRAGGEDR